MNTPMTNASFDNAYDQAMPGHGEGWDSFAARIRYDMETMEIESQKLREGPCPNAACEAIEFALSVACEEPISFLRCWNEGDFDSIRDEWPEAPGGVFIGAEPKLGTPTQWS